VTHKQIKPNFNKQVSYNGKQYKFTECIYWKNKLDGQFKYSAVLVDEINRSIRVDICKVEEI